MNARSIAAFVITCWAGVTHAQTSSFNVDGNKLSFEQGITSTLFQSVASFDGNQLQLSNNSAIAVEARVRDRNGYVLKTVLIPPASGGPLGEVLNLNLKSTAEKFASSITTGTPVTASVVHTGLTAEDIKQGISIEIVAGTARAQALTAINLAVNAAMLNAKVVELFTDVSGGSGKPVSPQGEAILNKLAEKLATDGSIQAMALNGGKLTPDVEDAVKDALIAIALDAAANSAAKLGVAVLKTIAPKIVNTIKNDPKVKAALKALTATSLYESGLFVGMEARTFRDLFDSGPRSTGYLALKINGQVPDYLLQGGSETYRLQVRPGFLGIGGAVEVTPMAIAPVTVALAEATPSTNANDNIATSGASTAVSNPNGIGLGYAGAFAHATSATTADYHKASGSQWTATANGTLLSWDLTASGSLSKGNIGTAQVVGAGSTPLDDGSTMYWGRWSGATVITANSGGSANGFSVPYVYGNAAVSLPTGKTFTYTYAGGTPILLSGTVQGQSLPGGTITVNTTARSIQLNNLAFGYNAGSVVGAATFSMSGSGSYSSNTNPGGFGGTLTGTCTGGSCGGGAGAAATGGYAGRFTGTTGTGIGLVYGAVTTAAVGPPAMPFIGGTVAAAFKR